MQKIVNYKTWNAKIFIKKMLIFIMIVSISISGIAINNIKETQGATNVLIDSVNFPDAVFRQYIADNFDVNNNGSLSDGEIAAVTEIYTSDYNCTSNYNGNIIHDYTGIKLFLNLIRFTTTGYGDFQTVYDGNSTVTNLDLSNMKNLQEVSCAGLGLEELNLSGCNNLSRLDCSGNKLNSLDLSSCQNIQSLMCGGNYLLGVKGEQSQYNIYLRTDYNNPTITIIPSNNFAIDFKQYTDVDYKKIKIEEKYLDGANWSNGVLSWENSADIPDTIDYEYLLNNSNSMNIHLNLKVGKVPIKYCNILLDKETFDYTGKGCIPNVLVSYNEKKLNRDTDYTVTYSNNVNPGIATVTIVGKGEYEGSITKSFNILKVNLSDCNVTMDNNFYYCGGPIEPQITIDYKGITYKNGRDFNVTYSNNINVGTGQVRISGINIIGNDTYTFNIQYVDINDLQIEIPNGPNTYTGNEIKPEVRLVGYGTSGQRYIIPANNYYVEYFNNIDIGTGTIRIIGENQCEGIRSINFQIVQQPTTRAPQTTIRTPRSTTTTTTTIRLSKPSKVKAKKYKKRSIKVSWKKVGQARVYEVRVGKKIFKTTKNNCIVKKLKRNKTYKISVRARAKYYLGPWSKQIKIKIKW